MASQKRKRANDRFEARAKGMPCESTTSESDANEEKTKDQGKIASRLG